MRDIQHSLIYPYLLLCAAILACVGCVTVNPSNVHVSGSIGSSHPPGTAAPAASVREPAYAPALRKVIHQQEKVAKELQKRDWPELLDESNDWIKYTRALIGYADTSHDPVKFRQRADALLAATEAIRRAAGQHDGNACQRALNACDMPLNQLCRDFPLAITPHRQGSRQSAWTQSKSNQRPSRVP